MPPLQMVVKHQLVVMLKQKKRLAFLLNGFKNFFLLYFKGKEDEGNDKEKPANAAATTKKKKKEIDLPITPRVPGASRKELDGFIETEVCVEEFQLI